jgi:hypothetical protein
MKDTAPSPTIGTFPSTPIGRGYSAVRSLSYLVLGPSTNKTGRVLESDDDSDSLTDDLYDLYEVFATERKKREPRSSKLPSLHGPPL